MIFNTAPVTKAEKVVKLEKLGKVQELLSAVEKERKNKTTANGQAIRVVRVGAINH